MDLTLISQQENYIRQLSWKSFYAKTIKKKKRKKNVFSSAANENPRQFPTQATEENSTQMKIVLTICHINKSERFGK